MSTDPESGAGLTPERAFAALGHETRLAILFSLWEARDPEEHVSRSALSFSELRKHVGMRDGSQFNYHLKPLLGRFVHHTEDGYVLTRAGDRIVGAVLAGSLTEDVVFDAVPYDDPCPLCGGQVVFEAGTERTLGWFVVRCTECPGGFGDSEIEGSLSVTDYLAPTSTRNRAPEEHFRATMVRVKHHILSMVEDVCPECTGPVSATPSVCPDHHVEPGRVCENCDSVFGSYFLRVCDICHNNWVVVGDRHFLTHPTVLAFLHDHGYDPWSFAWHRIELDIVRQWRVVSEEPFELVAELEADGDELVVTLDAQGTVIDVGDGASGQ